MTHHPIFHRIFNKRNILLFCGVSLIALAFGYVQDLQDMYRALVNFFADISAYNAWLAAALFFALNVLSAALSIFSSTPLIPAATELWGREVAFFMLYGGWIVGGCIAYTIGYYAHNFVKHLRIYKKINEYMVRLSGHSEYLIILLFRLAAPSEIGAYTLGILRYPFWRYFVITCIAELPFAIFSTYSSNTLVAGRPFLFMAQVGGGIIFIGLMVFLFHALLSRANKKNNIL